MEIIDNVPVWGAPVDEAAAQADQDLLLHLRPGRDDGRPPPGLRCAVLTYQLTLGRLDGTCGKCGTMSFRYPHLFAVRPLRKY